MKKTKLLASILLMGAFFIGCSNGSDDHHGGGSYGGDGNQGAKTGKIESSVIKFKTGSFKALGIVDDNEEGFNANIRSAARDAGRSSADDMIVKILEDGSMESFISVPSNVDLAPVNYIARSPLPDAKEIYIVFNYSTNWWSEDGNGSIGQLLCVNEDGSYYDILAKDDGTYKWLYNSSQDAIAFDETGCMYYLANENSGNNNTNMIYKFDPKTGISSQLTQAITNTSYQKMQISKDGKWIFTKAYRWNDNNNSTQYLRAIPTDNPADFVNLFYTSSNSSWINDWYYDDDTQTIYYIQDSKLYSIPQKDGTFNKDNRVTIFSSNSNGCRYLYWDTLLSNTSSNQIVTWTGCADAKDITGNQGSRYYYFRNPDSQENEIQAQEILDYLYAKAWYSFDSSKYSWENWKNDYASHKYEIRFDKFASVPGYEALAIMTKGTDGKALTDLDLINAIIDNGLEEILFHLLNPGYDNSVSIYSPHEYFSNFYEHNFFADILYEKDTGAPISTALFEKKTYGNTSKYYYMGIDTWSIFKTSWSNGRTWKKDFLDGKELLPEKVLNTLAELCGKSEIDFSLECFENDPKYSLLYTDLKNEEAVNFLNTTVRLSKLGEYLCDNDNWDDRNAYGKFLLKTCFVKDSNYTISAYTWRESDNDTIWWNSVQNLTPSYQKSLYGVYNYNNGNGITNGLIKILNETGAADGEFVAALQNYKIADIIAADGGFYFKSALLDSTGEESGNHQILYFNAVDSSVNNLFDKVEQNTSLEVISFSVGGGCVYFSAAKGLSVINGKIDIATKNYTELSSNTKLTQIITVK